MDDKDLENATAIFEYIVDNSQNPRTKLNAQLRLIDIELEDPTEKQLATVEKQFENLVDEYGNQSQTLQLQIAYANFLTFKREQPEPAVQMLKESLELPMGRMPMAYLKLALGIFWCTINASMKH